MTTEGFLTALWGMEQSHPTAARRYGTESEKMARSTYLGYARKQDPTVTIELIGSCVNPVFRQMSCSPDGLIKSDETPEVILFEGTAPELLKRGDPLNLQSQ